MFGYNLLRHVRTYPGRNKKLLQHIGNSVDADPNIFVDQKLEVLVIGPGLMSTKIVQKEYSQALDRVINHTVDFKPGRFINFEHFELAAELAHYHNVSMTVVDNFGPCLSCIPKEFFFDYKNNSFSRIRRVAVNTYVHDIRDPIVVGTNPATQPISQKTLVMQNQYDVILAAVVFDRIAKQIPAIQHVDAALRIGGYLAVTVGRDSPKWDDILSRSYRRILDEKYPINVAAPYELWKKEEDFQLPVAKFRPPRHFNFQIDRGGGEPPMNATFGEKDNSNQSRA